MALDANCAYLDGALKGNDFICQSFSVADIGNYVFLNAAASLGSPIAAENANLAHWAAGLARRPSIEAEVAAMQEVFAKLMSAVPG